MVTDGLVPLVGLFVERSRSVAAPLDAAKIAEADPGVGLALGGAALEIGRTCMLEV